MADDDSCDLVRFYGFPDYYFRVSEFQRFVAAGHDHHGNGPCGGSRLEFAEDSPPVYLRQQQVEDDKVWSVLFDQP